MTPVEGDIEFANGYLMEYDPAVGWERIANVQGRSAVGRAAVVIDSTAALGTPEVVYRRNDGESMADAAARLRAEVTQTARNALSASIDTDELAQIIGAHRSTLIASKSFPDGRILNSRTCDCGYPLAWSGWVEAHDAHLAKQVRAHLLTREM